MIYYYIIYYNMIYFLIANDYPPPGFEMELLVINDQGHQYSKFQQNLSLFS